MIKQVEINNNSFKFNKMCSIENKIMPELIINILSYLDKEEILKISLISKRWYNYSLSTMNLPIHDMLLVSEIAKDLLNNEQENNSKRNRFVNISLNAIFVETQRTIFNQSDNKITFKKVRLLTEKLEKMTLKALFHLNEKKLEHIRQQVATHLQKRSYPISTSVIDSFNLIEASKSLETTKKIKLDSLFQTFENILPVCQQLLLNDKIDTLKRILNSLKDNSFKLTLLGELIKFSRDNKLNFQLLDIVLKLSPKDLNHGFMPFYAEYICESLVKINQIEIAIKLVRKINEQLIKNKCLSTIYKMLEENPKKEYTPLLIELDKEIARNNKQKVPSKSECLVC